MIDRAILSEIRAQLEAEMPVFVRIVRDDGIDALETLIRQIARDADSPGGRIGLSTLAGDRILGNLGIVPDSPGWLEADGFMILTNEVDDALLSVARSLRVRTVIRTTMLAVIPAILLLQIVVAFALASVAQRIISRQIDEMEEALEAFSQGDLSARLPRKGQLRDRFDDVASHFNEALDQVETLIGTIRRTGAAIAHDLRTPLTRVSLGIHAALDDPDNADAGLARADREIRGMVDIADAILGLSEIESAVGREMFTTFDLTNLVAEICETYAPVLEDAGGRIASGLPESDAEVFADRRLIAQAVVNLVENAIRHCQGTVTIALTVEVGPDDTRLIVADNGPGVPEDEATRIFEPHYRIDKTRAGAGSGLGLAIVQAVVERHDGSVGAASPDTGLVVTMVLPIRTGADET